MRALLQARHRLPGRVGMAACVRASWPALHPPHWPAHPSRASATHPPTHRPCTTQIVQAPEFHRLKLMIRAPAAAAAAASAAAAAATACLPAASLMLLSWRRLLLLLPLLLLLLPPLPAARREALRWPPPAGARSALTCVHDSPACSRADHAPAATPHPHTGPPAVQRRGELTARNVANVLWGLAKMNHHPGARLPPARASVCAL